MPLGLCVEMPAFAYQIKQPIIALCFEQVGHILELVPAGAFVTVDSTDFEGDRLVDVSWDGKKVMMLTQDLRSRADRVEGFLK